MLPRRRWTRGLLPAALVFLAGVLLHAVPTPSQAEEASKDRQIAELEKQLQQLSKQLQELRATNGTAATPTAASTSAIAEGTIPADWIKPMTWRSIGPANMSGRITAISVFEADPTTYWVATASGGLIKTVNNGVSFEHQFDREATVSIGDVCVAPSDKNIVWVGTGEGNPRNSVSYGNGVYKSTDSGKTWKLMGLEKTYQVGKVVVHPKDPNVVYVGALGRLYGSSADRGVYKTTDGGATWNKVLFIDDKTGIIDLQLSPTEPDTLLAAAWDRERDEFDDFLGPPPPDGIERYDPVRKYGKGAGIYKSTDAGKTWKKLAQGLPTCSMGRIGLDYYRKDPKIVYAVIDTEKYGTGLPPVTVYLGVTGSETPVGYKLTDVAANGPSAKAGLKVDDLLLSLDGKAIANTPALLAVLQPHKEGDKLKATYQRGTEKAEVEIALAARPAGGPGGGGGGGMRFPNPGFFAEDAEGGAVVTEIMEGGPAAQAGLKIDDLIVAIDGKPFERYMQTMGRLTRSMRAGDTVKVTYKRGDESKEVAIAVQLGGFERLRGRTPAGHTPRPNTGSLGGNRENITDQQGPDGFQTGGIYKSTDGGETWTRVNSYNPRPMYFSVVRVDPSDDKIIWILGTSLYVSKDGGKTVQPAGNRGVHSDQHAMWVDPRDGRHMLLGSDGGFYQSYDRAEHWDHLNTLALGQFYHVALDPRQLYRVFGGLQDNGSWGGPAQMLRGSGPGNEDWLMVGGGDGFVCRVDPNDPDLVYSESQGGAIQRLHLKTGARASIRPLRTPGKPAHRFNWNTPFLLSSHNSSIFYCAGEYVWRSVQRGDHLHIISPEITRTKKGSATAFAESPRSADILWVGTDDGYLWLSRDGGNNWTELSAKLNLPGPRWIASIEPSRYVDGRAYVALDAHRSNDDEPYAYVTEDFGQTWKSLRGNLPTGSTRVLREDIVNQNVLYLGSEFGAWVSANRGASWTKLNNNLPTVAVHELAQHPTSGEIVAATHGRSLWILDVTPLRQMTVEAMKDKSHLFQPNTVVNWQREPGRDGWFNESDRHFTGQNPPRGAQIYYSLASKAEKVSMKVLDINGKTVSEFATLKGDPGLHLVAWNLSPGRQRAPGEGGPGGPGGRRGGGGGRGPGGPAGGPPAGAPGARPMGGGAPPAAGGPPAAGAAPAAAAEQEPGPEMAFLFGAPSQVTPGTYRLVLSIDGTELTQSVRVEPDPTQNGTVLTSDDDEDDEGDDGQ